jgi:NAD(P)-dependent dehydrogenase (short-subunit alcohol dehydrogenase family)
MDLNGKNVLVTGGGGTGVGKGICNVLARSGATILLNERAPETAENAAKNYPGAIPVAADITSEQEVKAMFREIEQKVGRIHGLVNNAGVGLSKMAHEVTADEFNRLYDTDIKGVWQVSRSFVNHLIKHNQPGSIVNISSVHAHSTMSRYAIYASAKSAVEGLTRGMAVELGPHNIRVNAVGPGYILGEHNFDLIRTWTDNPDQWVKDYINDQQALLFQMEPDDCGNVVAFLLSDLSRAVTGQTIYVDNGTTSLLHNRLFTEKK